MATDVKTHAEIALTKMLAFLAEHSIGHADIVSLYFDSRSGTHVLWYLQSVVDAQSPSIAYSPIANGQTAGMAVPVFVRVFPPAEAVSPLLYFRTAGAGWQPVVTMSAITADKYSADIPNGVVANPGVEYYIEVGDGVNLTSAGTALLPLTFTVP